jgi:hypothetical protein
MRSGVQVAVEDASTFLGAGVVIAGSIAGAVGAIGGRAGDERGIDGAIDGDIGNGLALNAAAVLGRRQGVRSRAANREKRNLEAKIGPRLKSRSGKRCPRRDPKT